LLGSGAQYNSLASVGLQLTSSFSQVVASGNTSSSSPITVQQQSGTDGQFQPLNAAALQAAVAANPSAIKDLFTGANGLVTQLGSFLTTATGSPTMTTTSIVGTVPGVSLMQGFENSIQSQVSSLQTQIQQIQDNANAQADQLRQEFVASEAAMAGYQSLQQEVSAYFGGSSSSSGSGGL
jgi:flagellar capping protein FliD